MKWIWVARVVAAIQAAEEETARLQQHREELLKQLEQVPRRSA